jgi:hypothetical protein
VSVLDVPSWSFTEIHGRSVPRAINAPAMATPMPSGEPLRPLVPGGCHGGWPG